jgi:hypothetical protein
VLPLVQLADGVSPECEASETRLLLRHLIPDQRDFRVECPDRHQPRSNLSPRHQQRTQIHLVVMFSTCVNNIQSRIIGYMCGDRYRALRSPAMAMEAI